MRVYADAEGLARALLNLLSNAVKYSGRSREIRLGVHRRGQEAEVRVTDYGIGIRAAEQQQIFQSFYRAPEAAKETTGAGLGLALVRHFVEAHGARVTVESEPGKGSAFSLWLPLVKNDGQDSPR
jgi:two-component system sensor histidine kinase SenX3